jgi:hypothetical protein
MTDLQCFSFSVGMTPEAQLALIRGERGPLKGSPAETSPEDPRPGASEAAADPEPPKAARKRRRAKTPLGTFRADDPATPQDEAWEDGAEAAAADGEREN